MDNEVIYISSDDEDENETEKVTNKQNNSVSYNGTHVEFNLVNINTSLQSDSEKEDVSKQKRKISEVNGACNAKDKRVKIELSEEVSEDLAKLNIKKSETKSQEDISIPPTRPTPTPTPNNVIVKPQLIIKEKKSISYVEQDVFPMFISLCLQKKREPDMEIIVNKLKRRYEQMDPTCAKSEVFQNFLNSKRNDILTNEKMVYRHIMDVMTEMKSKPRDTSKTAGQIKASQNNTCKSTVSSDTEKVENMEQSRKDMEKVENDEEDCEENYEEDSMDPHMQIKLKKIVQVMNACKKKIEALEKAEVDFDDEDNSNYIKLEKYKERMVNLYAEYCNITGDNVDAGRPYLRPKHLNPTHIVSVDQAITNFINAKITKRNKLKKNGRFTDDLIFPDYRDILKCVSNCNEKNNLGLDKRRQCQIAKKAFIDLGEHLQRVRRNDYWDTFSLFLENQPDDPALKNQELAQKLYTNKELGEQKLTQVFHEYVKKQEEMTDLLTKDKGDIDEDEDNNTDSNEEDENSDENDKDNEDEDENDEDTESNDNNEESGDENDDTSTPSINDIEGGMVECEGSTKNNLTHVSKNKSSEDVVINTSETSAPEIKCGETQSEDAFILSENVIEETSLAKEAETTIVQQLSTSTGNDTLGHNKDEITEVALFDNDCDVKTDESKPLLRVRSFAKPPTTWEDNKHKSQMAEDTAATEVIDLTAEISKANIELPKFAIQVGNKVLPLKGKYKTVVIPTNLAGKSIINVKNITNNYVKLNTRDIHRSSSSSNSKANQIVKSLPMVRQVVNVKSVNTIIRLPHVSGKQNTNASEKNNETKQKQTIVRFVIPTKQVRQNSTAEVPGTDISEKEAK